MGSPFEAICRQPAWSGTEFCTGVRWPQTASMPTIWRREFAATEGFRFLVSSHPLVMRISFRLEGAWGWWGWSSGARVSPLDSGLWRTKGNRQDQQRSGWWCHTDRYRPWKGSLSWTALCRNLLCLSQGRTPRCASRATSRRELGSLECPFLTRTCWYNISGVLTSPDWTYLLDLCLCSKMYRACPRICSPMLYSKTVFSRLEFMSVYPFCEHGRSHQVPGF